MGSSTARLDGVVVAGVCAPLPTLNGSASYRVNCAGGGGTVMVCLSPTCIGGTACVTTPFTNGGCVPALGGTCLTRSGAPIVVGVAPPPPIPAPGQVAAYWYSTPGCPGGLAALATPSLGRHLVLGTAGTPAVLPTTTGVTSRFSASCNGAGSGGVFQACDEAGACGPPAPFASSQVRSGGHRKGRKGAPTRAHTHPPTHPPTDSA